MKIRVYNRFLDLLFEIDRYESLQFKRSHHSISDFELHVNRYVNGAEHLQKGNLIALGKQSNKVGIIQSKEIALDESGKESENFKLTGYSLEGLMERRITQPPSHTSHDRISGSAESVMKHYVYNNFINTTDERKMPYFGIADNQGRGEHIKYESRYKTVSDELENISVSTGLGWTVYADFKNKELTFDVIETKDLTQGNRQGNNPVFFSPEFETIKSQEFIDSDQELKNVGYVGGQGEGVERKIVEIGDIAGWDRIETFVDARDIGDTTEDDDGEEVELTPEEEEELLIERGQDKMREMETIFTLEAEILTPVTRKTYEKMHEGYRHPGQPVSRLKPKIQAVTPFEYEKDFDLGDRVDVVNKSWNLKMTAPITEIIEVYESSGFRIDATFGRNRPTLISKLQDKFDDLEGIEKQEAPERVSVARMDEAKEYARNQDVYVRQDAEEYTEDYTYPKDSIDNKDQSVYQNGTFYTDQRMEQANREIKDTKARVEQAVKDLGEADETINEATEDIKKLRDELDSLPDNSEDINELTEKINAANERIDTANQSIEDARNLIDSVTEDKDGQTVLKGTLITNELIAENATLTGSFKGSDATIEDLTTEQMTALNAIIQDAIIKGRLDAAEATMLGLTTEQMTAINATIRDATITGNLNASDAIFQKGRFDEATIVNAVIENVQGLTGTFDKVTAHDEDGFLLEKDGLRHKVAPERNLIQDHSFEFIQGDIDTVNPDYWWADAYSPNNLWSIHGSPKTNFFYVPTDRRAYPLFGDQSIIVRNAHYVSQIIQGFPGDNTTYTISGHFKRQWNQSPGKPRFEVDLIDGETYERERLINEIFDTVPNDYSDIRHSATFYVPEMKAVDYIQIKISGGDSNWVQCDGVQLVNSDTATTYITEDGTWLLASGRYPVNNNQDLLWSGERYPTDTQTIRPDKKLSECKSGWLLMWQNYNPGSGSTNSNFQYVYIPKTHGITKDGYGVSVWVHSSGSIATRKYIYVYDDRIVGHSINGAGDARQVALTEVRDW